ADDDRIDSWQSRNRQDPASDVRGRAFPLNAGRSNDQVRVGVPALQYVDDVADCRAVQRRHDTDLAWKRGQWPLAAGVEQAFAVQPPLQLIEGELQRTEALRLHVLGDELVLAFRLVHRHAAARNDAQAILGLEFQIPERGP